ncbi:MAG TPA: hypothetical protein VJ715_05075 [Pyrinomonadaceae bacterium]|nr:hypothetical protein [Pyrinomonadaceae bacterium]
MRFCSRCGFQLGVVKELLTQTEATVPTAVEPLPPVPARGLRKRDVTIGALLMYVISVALIIISSPIPPLRNDQIFVLSILFVALTLFINFISPLLRAVNKLFNEENNASRRAEIPRTQAAPDLTTQVSAHRAELPPARSVPAALFNSPRVNTAEMLQPPSITEHTTNLLDNKRTSGAL